MGLILLKYILFSISADSTMNRTQKRQSSNSLHGVLYNFMFVALPTTDS